MFPKGHADFMKWDFPTKKLTDWLTDWWTDWLTDRLPDLQVCMRKRPLNPRYESQRYACMHAKQAVHIKDLIPKFHPNEVGFALSFTSCYNPAGVWRKIQHSVWVEKPWEAGTKDDCRSKHLWLHRKLAKDPFRDIFPYCRTSLLSNLLSKHFRSSWCLNSIVLQV